MDRRINNILLSLISAAFNIPGSYPEIKKEDVPIIEAIATKQSIIPVITVGMKNTGHGDLITESLKNKESKAIFDFTQRVSSLKEISDIFEKEKIPYIPLKGSFLRGLYPQPWMRTSADIDVLIHIEDLDKAIKVLNTYTSFKYYHKKHHDVHFVNERVHLELHFSLLSRNGKMDKLLCDAWKYTVTSSFSYKCSFTPEFLVFYITSHSAKHFFAKGGIGIRPILDLYVLRINTVYDEEQVKCLCEEAGILGFYNTSCKLIDVWFNGDKHDETSELFEKVVLSGGVFGSDHIKIVSNKRKDSGKKYILSRVFISSDLLKQYYPNCSKYPILLPFYQIVRWCTFLRLKSTNEILSEFKQAESISQNEIEMYDKLMKGMGL